MDAGGAAGAEAPIVQKDSSVVAIGTVPAYTGIELDSGGRLEVLLPVAENMMIIIIMMARTRWRVISISTSRL